MQQDQKTWEAGLSKMGHVSIQKVVPVTTLPSLAQQQDQRSNAQVINTTSGPVGFTVRECEVIKLLHEGCSAKISGQKLGISSRTVEMHLRHIKAKIGVKTKYAVLAAIDIDAIPTTITSV